MSLLHNHPTCSQVPTTNHKTTNSINILTKLGHQAIQRSHFQARHIQCTCTQHLYSQKAIRRYMYMYMCMYMYNTSIKFVFALYTEWYTLYAHHIYILFALLIYTCTCTCTCIRSPGTFRRDANSWTRTTLWYSTVHTCTIHKEEHNSVCFMYTCTHVHTVHKAKPRAVAHSSMDVSHIYTLSGTSLLLGHLQVNTYTHTVTCTCTFIYTALIHFTLAVRSWLNHSQFPPSSALELIAIICVYGIISCSILWHVYTRKIHNVQGCI